MITASADSGGSHSLNVNGTTAYVQVANSSSLNISGQLTLEAWIKLNSSGAYRNIVSRESWNQAGSGGGYQLSVNNVGKVRLDLYQSPTQYTPTTGIQCALQVGGVRV